MMATFRDANTLRWGMLAVIAVLLVVVFVVLACRPSAQDGQDGGGATREPTATPTLTPEPTATAEPTATPTPEPSPTPTTSPNDKYLEPMVHAFIRQANEDTGTSGASESTVRVIVTPADNADAVRKAVRDFLTDNGAAHVTGKRIAIGTYDVPVSLLARLAQHPQVGAVLVASSNFPYPSMDRTLNNVVAAWQNGATPEEAARLALIHHQDKVVVGVGSKDRDADNPASLEAAKQFFDDNNVWVNPVGYAHRNGNNTFATFVPVSLLGGLAQVPHNRYDTLEWTREPTLPYTAEELQIVELALDRYLEPSLRPTPTPTATPDPGANAPSGAAGTSAPEPTATLYLIDDGTPWPVDHPVKKKYSNLDSTLSRLAEEYEAAQAPGQGAAGQATREVDTLEVIITLDSGADTAAVVQFLKDNGAGPTYGYMDLPYDGYGYDTSLAATVPVSALAGLAGLPGVVFVDKEHGPAPHSGAGPS